MRKSLVCASPAHEGDRLMAHAADLVEKRIEYRRLSDEGRDRVKLLYLCCKACMRVELQDPVDVEMPLFGGVT